MNIFSGIFPGVTTDGGGDSGGKMARADQETGKRVVVFFKYFLNFRVNIFCICRSTSPATVTAPPRPPWWEPPAAPPVLWPPSVTAMAPPWPPSSPAMPRDPSPLLDPPDPPDPPDPQGPATSPMEVAVEASTSPSPACPACLVSPCPSCPSLISVDFSANSRNHLSSCPTSAESCLTSVVEDLHTNPTEAVEVSDSPNQTSVASQTSLAESSKLKR